MWRCTVTVKRKSGESGFDRKGKESIGTDIRTLDAMLTELLESVRLESENGRIHTVECKLETLLKEVVEELNFDRKPVEYAKPAETVSKFVDKPCIRTVLKNVLKNAIKYSKESALPVALYLRNTKAGAENRVVDFGEGIPQKELPHIFEPFYRADKSRPPKTGGFGLGLSLARKIVDAHDGSIYIASEEGKGTVITILLPWPNCTSKVIKKPTIGDCNLAPIAL